VKVSGKAVRIAGDNIDTDALYPGIYLNVQDTAQIPKHLFAGLDPELNKRVGRGTVLVVDDNFGTGSSREQVPIAMKASGVTAVIGKSFARIFHRNCINLGLLAIAAPDAADAAKDDSNVEIDIENGRILVDGTTFAIPTLPPFVRDIVELGGLVPWLRLRAEKTNRGGVDD